MMRLVRLTGMLQGAQLALPMLGMKTAWIYRLISTHSGRGWRERLHLWSAIR